METRLSPVTESSSIGSLQPPASEFLVPQHLPDLGGERVGWCPLRAEETAQRFSTTPRWVESKQIWVEMFLGTLLFIVSEAADSLL